MKHRKITFIWSLLVSLGMLLVVAPMVHAGTYYVSPTATNTNYSTCTSTSNPCALTAAMANAVAGDTVYLMNGTYAAGVAPSSNQPYWTPAHSGTSGNPITFKALNQLQAIFTEPGGGISSPILGSYGQNYITYDGLELQFPQDERAFSIWNSTGCAIQNCEIIGDAYGDATVNHEAIRIENASGVLISNNIIHGVHSNPEGAYDSSAIKSFTGSNMTIKNNTVYDCTSGFYDKAQGQNNSYYYNLIYDLSGLAFHVMTQTMSGEGAGNGATNNISIYQNIVYGFAGEALFIDQNGNTLTLDNTQFYSNTIDMTGLSSAFGVYAFEQSTNTGVYNNIFYTPSSNYFTAFFASNTKPAYENNNDIYSTTLFEAYRYNTGGTQKDYSTIASWCSTYGFDCNSISADPMFVSVSTHDYHLNPGSPAFTSGRGGSYPSVMGAYITGNETIGVTSTSTVVPSAPTNLQVQ